MRFFKIAMALMALLLFVCSSRMALADGRVVVVEVHGDVDDANALRTAIAGELKATVVAPDDPRAASAGGTLTIDVRGADKRIAATYRSLGSPVTRTVDLPEDPKRARSVAVLLAGNVAREEADDLLDTLRKSPPPAKPAAKADEAEQDLRRLHAAVDELGEHNIDYRKWRAIASFAQAGITAGLGIYYWADGPEHTTNAGQILVAGAVGSAGAGAILLFAGPLEPYEGLQRELAKGEGRLAPEDVVRRVESKWGEAASDARSFRKVVGGIAVGIGVLSMGMGVALPALVPDEQEDSFMTAGTAGLVLLGGINLTLGIDALCNESGVEQSWHVYRRMKDLGTAPTTSAGLQPKVGLAPLPGGGMASLGFAF